MHFQLNRSLAILERTPIVLDVLLRDLSKSWTTPNEGGETWSAFDIVGHLIHGEKTDWIPRMQIILNDGGDKEFVPYDRFAQFEASKGKELTDLLEEFSTLRAGNLKVLRSRQLTASDMSRTGIHPDFGEVTLAQLLATWTVHDLNHIGQIVRVMAKQYQDVVGPWKTYLGILHQ
jgi:uncharacterized damage-inducible protein DinB